MGTSVYVFGGLDATGMRFLMVDGLVVARVVSEDEVVVVET